LTSLLRRLGWTYRDRSQEAEAKDGEEHLGDEAGLHVVQCVRVVEGDGCIWWNVVCVLGVVVVRVWKSWSVEKSWGSEKSFSISSKQVKLQARTSLRQQFGALARGDLHCGKRNGTA